MNGANDPAAPRRTPYRIETRRLVLRPYAPADAGALRDVCAANRDHLLPWLTWAEADPQTLDEKLDLVLRFRALYDREEKWVMGLFDRDGGALLGGSGYHDAGADPRRVREVGYWIAREHAGRGLVTEAVVALVSVAFRWLRCAAVVIRCQPENGPSRAIPERLGFTDEGLQRAALTPPGHAPLDAHRYSLTRREFEAGRAGFDAPLAAFDALGRELPLDDCGVRAGRSVWLGRC